MKQLHLSLIIIAGIAATTYSASGQSIYEPYRVTTIAGCGSNIGSTDGPPDEAQFFNPQGTAADKEGNVYVVEEGNHAIRKITPDGVVSTFAGVADEYGSADGKGSAARFFSPGGILVGRDGLIYVADTENDTIRVINRHAVVRTLAGVAGSFGFVDGKGSAARFSHPRGLAMNNAGDLFVADQFNYSVRKVTPDGTVTTFAGDGISGFKNGNGSDAEFSDLDDLTIDQSGNLFVADTENFEIREITPAAEVTTYAQLGYLQFPGAIAIDRYSRVVESDTFHINIIGPDNQITLFAGSTYGSEDGVGAEAEFSSVADLGRDRFGNFFVPDFFNNTIRKVTPQGKVTTFAGIAQIGSRDGVGTAARFYYPSGMTRDSSGAIYISDSSNHTIRKMTPDGAVTTFAGKAQAPGHVDGNGANARFNDPEQLAIDSADNIYVADSGNGLVRKITPAADVTTLANGHHFNSIVAVAVESSGSVYVAADSAISRIAPDGTVTVFAGMLGEGGFVDGQGSAARFDYPGGMVFDSAGNLFVADSQNNAIRKITPDAKVTTFAGGRRGTRDGVGRKARFYYPLDLTMDGAGNLYVSDYVNCTLRKITPAASTTTLAGLATWPGWMDGTGREARLNGPRGVISDADGNLFFAETQNQVVRQAIPAGK